MSLFKELSTLANSGNFKLNSSIETIRKNLEGLHGEPLLQEVMNQFGIPQDYLGSNIDTMLNKVTPLLNQKITEIETGAKKYLDVLDKNGIDWKSVLSGKQSIKGVVSSVATNQINKQLSDLNPKLGKLSWLLPVQLPNSY